MANEGPPLSPVLWDREFSKETCVQQRGRQNDTWTAGGQHEWGMGTEWGEADWVASLATEHTTCLPQEHLLFRKSFQVYWGGGGWGACCLGVMCRGYAPPSANAVNLWELPLFKCLYISYTRKSHGPSCHKLNTILKTRSAKKGSIQKSKHISFNCQDYSRARVHFQSLLSGLHSSVAQPRPLFQFILEFALSRPPHEASERGAALLNLQQPINHHQVQQTSRLWPAQNAPSCFEPGGADRCVF